MGRTRKTDKHLPRRVYLKHGAYFFVDNENKWHRLGTSIGEAYRALSAFALEERSIRSTNDLCDRYQREILSTYTVHEQKTRVPHLVRIKAVFGEMDLPDVTSKDVRMFRDKVGQRVGLEWKRPQLAKKAMMVLSHLFTVAAEWHVVEANPCRGVPRPPQPRRTRYPTDHEFAAVRERCAPMLQVAMDIALLTGLRRGDVLKLTRDSVTDVGLRVETTKTDKPLLFTMTADLKAAIDRALAIEPKVRRYVICNLQGDGYTGDGFSSLWNRARSLAVEEKAIGLPFAFNDIRAKSARDDESVDRASQRLVHNDRQTTEQYYIRTPRKVSPLR